MLVFIKWYKFFNLNNFFQELQTLYKPHKVELTFPSQAHFKGARVSQTTAVISTRNIIQLCTTHLSINKIIV